MRPFRRSGGCRPIRGRGGYRPYGDNNVGRAFYGGIGRGRNDPRPDGPDVSHSEVNSPEVNGPQGDGQEATGPPSNNLNIIIIL